VTGANNGSSLGAGYAWAELWKAGTPASDTKPLEALWFFFSVREVEEMAHL